MNKNQMKLYRLTGCTVISPSPSYVDAKYVPFKSCLDTADSLYQILSEIYKVDSVTGLPTEDVSLSSRTDLSPAALSVFRDILHKEYPKAIPTDVDDETLMDTCRSRISQLGGENLQYADALRAYIDRYSENGKGD